MAFRFYHSRGRFFRPRRRRRRGRFFRIRRRRRLTYFDLH